MRRVRPHRLHLRPHRAVLPAVRADHRHLHGDLGLQLPDPVAGPGRRAAEGPSRTEGPLLAHPRQTVRQLAVRPLQPHVRACRWWLCRHRAPRAAWQRHRHVHLRGPAGARLPGLLQHPGRLRAATGQAVPGGLRPATGRRHPGPHRSSDQAHVRDRREASGRGEHRGLPRPVHQRLHQQPEQRHRVHPAQALR
ncbi:hypothetical protein D3C85_1060150 [compost metagenome]